MHKKSYACSTHFEDLFSFKNEELSSLEPKHEISDVSVEEKEELLNSLRNVINEKENSGNYFEEIDDNELKTLTVVSKNSFNELLSSLKISIDKPKSLALGVYLNKMRTGNSYEQLSVRFGLTKSSLFRYINKVRVIDKRFRGFEFWFRKYNSR